MVLRSILFPLACAVVLGAGAHALHLPAAARLGPASGEELPVFFLPDGADLRPFAMGHATTLSDFYWLREIQYIGTPAAEHAGYPQLLALGDLVTDLDPLHGYAYQVTGIMLSQVRHFDESSRIFDKGRKQMPQRWELPFYEAFNYYYELREYARGAELLSEAARIPGAPAYVSRLASMLFAAGGRVESAMAFVESMLSQQDLPDESRKDLEEQHFELQIERDLQTMDGAVARYAKLRGTRPARLEDLVGVALEVLPLPPAGSTWTYDPATGHVRSSLQERRLRYFPDRGPEAEDPLQASP